MIVLGKQVPNIDNDIFDISLYILFTTFPIFDTTQTTFPLFPQQPFSLNTYIGKMKSPTQFLFQQKHILLKLLIFIFCICSINRNNICCNQHFATPSSFSPSLKQLKLEGYLSFEELNYAAKDFGNRCHFFPLAILYPKSVLDISSTIKHVFEIGAITDLTVAARGHGHSLEGQAQAYQGLVINMESLQGPAMKFNIEELSYVDVSAGELWINILHESLKLGLAPKSWTDYLHLTVGGTLSNAGISGQAFKHGPQINNVYQLEVVTGTFVHNRLRGYLDKAYKLVKLAYKHFLPYLCIRCDYNPNAYIGLNILFVQW